MKFNFRKTTRFCLSKPELYKTPPFLFSRIILIAMFYLCTVITMSAQEEYTVFVEETGQTFVLKDTASLGALYDAVIFISDEADGDLTEQMSDYAMTGIEAATELELPAFSFLFSGLIVDQDMRAKIFHDTTILQSTLTAAEQVGSRFNLNKMLIQGIHFQLGDRAFYVERDYEKALSHYFACYDILKETNETQGKNYALWRISNVYDALGDFDTAVKYIRMVNFTDESEVEYIRLNSELVYLRKLSKLYGDYNKRDSLLFYNQKMLKLANHLDTLSTEDLNYERIRGEVQFAYGAVFDYYLKEGNIKKAEGIFKKMQREQFHNRDTYDNLALKMAIANGNLKKAEDLMNQKEVAASKKYVENTISDFYEKSKDYKTALFHTKKFYENKLESTNAIRQKYAAFADTKYETVKKEDRIVLLEAEKKQEQLKMRFWSVILLFLTILTATLIYLLKQNKARRVLLEKDLENKEIIEMQSKELQKTDELKSRLFTNIAHELRTPLTLIAGPLEHLSADNSLNKKAQSVLAMASRNSEQLLNLVNEISDLSKAEVENLSTQLSFINLKELLDYLFERFSFIAERKEIDLRFDIEAADTSLVTDAKKLETILQNIIVNALKYSEPQDKIDVIVQTSNQEVTIKIKDTGRGISAVDLPKIFDRYYQAVDSEIPPEGGLGIGLAISKEYIRLIGGSIEVVSIFGKGTEFIIKFPKQLSIPDNVQLETINYLIPVVKSIEKEKIVPIENNGYILIVEDNLDLCSHLENILSSDYDVSFAHNGKEGLQKIEAKMPTLVITDLMMPIMGGMEMIQEMKMKPELANLPVLVLTARNNILDELKSIRVGVDDYLIKPFKEDELKTIIYNLLFFSENREKEYLTDIVLGTSVGKSLSATNTRWLSEIEEKIIPAISDYTLDLDALASMLGMSTTHLNRKMKEVIGMTPKRYVNEIRLLTGRRMLENKEEDSVKAVAFSVGYKSEKVFSRSFIQRFGKYPSDYLK